MYFTVRRPKDRSQSSVDEHRRQEVLGHNPDLGRGKRAILETIEGYAPLAIGIIAGCRME
mgnify:CR=1 FL=1|jgi:hypothetical protein